MNKLRPSTVTTCKVILHLAILLISMIPISAHAAEEDQIKNKIILVTAFEPFGGKTTNGSWEAVKNLNNTRINDKIIIIHQLPVVWEKASQKLFTLMVQYQPVAVIAFGEADAQPVRLETVARNVREPYKDNIAQLPQTRYIAQNAPATLTTTLNVDLIAQRLREEGIPVTFSNSAGGYLCNETFFNLMNFTHPSIRHHVVRGFVHVPPHNAEVITPQLKTLLFNEEVLQKTALTIIEAVAEGL